MGIFTCVLIMAAATVRNNLVDILFAELLPAVTGVTEFRRFADEKHFKFRPMGVVASRAVSGSGRGMHIPVLELCFFMTAKAELRHVLNEPYAAGFARVFLILDPDMTRFASKDHCPVFFFCRCTEFGMTIKTWWG